MTQERRSRARGATSSPTRKAIWSGWSCIKPTFRIAMALAALDLLSCVIAPRAAALRGFHRLAVNHSCRRARLSASRLARRHNERVVHRGKDSVVRPRVEIALNRGVGWKILRQLSPLAAGGCNVEDRVHQCSHVCFARTPKG